MTIQAELDLQLQLDGEMMQSKSKHTQKQHATICAACGKTFDENEKTVSYDFERFYCFRCDDER